MLELAPTYIERALERAKDLELGLKEKAFFSLFFLEKLKFF